MCIVFNAVLLLLRYYVHTCMRLVHPAILEQLVVSAKFPGKRVHFTEKMRISPYTCRWNCRARRVGYSKLLNAAAFPFSVWRILNRVRRKFSLEVPSRFTKFPSPEKALRNLRCDLGKCLDRVFWNAFLIFFRYYRRIITASMKFLGIVRCICPANTFAIKCEGATPFTVIRQGSNCIRNVSKML